MIRKAKLNDVKEIQRLIKLYAPRGGILPRSLSELYDHLRDFFVFVRNRKVVGICALHICWDDLAEIRSLAVAGGGSEQRDWCKIGEGLFGGVKTFGGEEGFCPDLST